MPKMRTDAVKARTGAFFFSVYGVFVLAGMLAVALVYHLPALVVMTAALALVWGASYLWAAISLHGVSALEVLYSTRVFPGEEVAIRLTLTNRKWLPLAWVKLEKPGTPLMGDCDSPYISSPDGRKNCQLGWLFWFQEACWDYRVIPFRRGLYRLGPMILTSGDPFGFFYRSRTIPSAPELLVYPPLVDVSLAVPSWPDPLGEKQARDFLYADPLAVAGVREYSPGDPLRQINWVATAKTQKLLSNLLEGSVGTRVILVIGDLQLEQLDWTNRVREFAFELIVAAAASLALALADQRVEVGLLNPYTLSQGHPVYLPPGPGDRQGHLQEILTRLAVLTRKPAGDPAGFLAQCPLSLRARLIILTSVYREKDYREWQGMARGRPLTYLVLDQGTESLPAGVYPLFPGWQENRKLARQVMGPLWEVE